MQGSAGDARGAVYVEFIICFMPVFLLFLGVVQLAFMASAKLVVQHAAVMGARSAMVVLEDDDPERYGPEGFGVIDYGSSGSSGTSQSNPVMNRLAGWFGAPVGQLAGRAGLSRGGPRLKDIRKAVYVPLMALAPPFRLVAGWFDSGLRQAFGWSGAGSSSLAGAIGSSPGQRFAAGLLYNRAAAVVTFHRPGSREIFEGAYGPTDSATVRVTYLFHCAVPLVSRFMCERPFGLSGAEASAQEIRDAISDPAGLDPQRLAAMVGETRRSLQELRQSLELFSRAESFALTLTLVLADARFAQLSAQATMPIQGAGYYRRGDD